MIRPQYEHIAIGAGISLTIDISSYPTGPVDEEVSSGWLYESLADLYSRWIPDADLDAFRSTGFYSTQIQPGLRAVAVNSNMCNMLNP